MDKLHLAKAQFVKDQMRIWGEEYVEDLLDRGYEPTLLQHGDTTKWVWLQQPRVLQLSK